MSLLDPVRLVDLARGSGSLPRRLLLPSHRWPREPFVLVAPMMDLPLPVFADPADRPARPLRPWIVMTQSTESPAPVRLMTPLRSPSPCLNLDALSSDESAGPGDVSAVPICILDYSSTPVNPDQVLSDDDLSTAVSEEDRRQVIRIRDVPPEVQVVGLSQNVQTGDWLCGDRSSRQILRALLRSRLFVLWPCLWRSGLVKYLRGLGPLN